VEVFIVDDHDLPRRISVQGHLDGVPRIPNISRMGSEDARSGLPRPELIVAGAALLMGLAVIPVGLADEFHEPRGIWAVAGPLIGWSFVGVGLYATMRPPNRSFGVLMVVTGFAWFVAVLALIDTPLVVSLGVPLGSIWLALVAYALLAFPSGRLHSTADWVVVACLAVAFVFVWIPVLLLTPDIGRLFDCDTCPSNPLAVADVQAAGDALIWVRVVLLVAAFALMCFLLGLRWRRATPTQRRSLTPILFTGLLLAAVFVLSGALYLAPGLDALADGMEWAIYPVVVAVPFAFLFGLARSHLFRTGAVASLVQRLGGRLDAGELRDALADALGDPSLAIAFWLPESRRYVDAGGRPAELPAEDSSRATTPIEHDGRPVAALIHDAALREEPELVRGLGTAASLALENERLEAELRAKVEEVRQSRARLVTAGDSERRRLERDLHDGAQQRFVTLALQLRRARAQLADDAPSATLLDGALDQLSVGLSELRELARGIHPAILSDKGLAGALRSLIARAPVSVTVLEVPEYRLPTSVETAAYFLVAEALTNVAKYARATQATVSVVGDDGVAVVEVRDDGVGGADPSVGSGLRGLADRIAALDGELELQSPPGEGTTLRARLPCF
jgi:signal transduction histidine kinase